ncbi:MAG TPA: plasmid stabilization protein [Stellaceae bacterium]|nr:plasmid stabilization protein [Stellaceae bacterium]
MAQILVRNLDDELKGRLTERARRHGWSTEEEVREILRSAVMAEKAALPFGSGFKAHFTGIELDEDIAELRGQPARPADFSE